MTDCIHPILMNNYCLAVSVVVAFKKLQWALDFTFAPQDSKGALGYLWLGRFVTIDAVSYEAVKGMG